MRRLGSIIPFLTILSLICVSFAFWTLVDPTPVSLDVSNNFEADDIIHYNFIPGDQYQLLGSYSQSEIKTFTYQYEGDGYVDGTPNDGKFKFTSKNIIIPIYANRTNLKNKITYDDSGCFYLKFVFSYHVETQGSDILIPTGKIKCILKTTENIYFEFHGSFDSTNNQLTVLIPIKSVSEYSLYNLVAQDNKTTNESKIPLNLNIEFTYKTTSKTEYTFNEFNSFLDVVSTYSYSMSYEAK